jgi:pimeloyl-ACP methyl ester carboxylesterase
MRKATILGCMIYIVFACKEEKQLQPLNFEEAMSRDEVAAVKTETITFPSLDGLPITADVYKVVNTPITMLLCHQAGYSRGEYKDTASKLNALGYSVMAIDQRSGNVVDDVVNETAKLAKAQDLPTNYIDSRKDIEAAINSIYKNNGNRQMLIVGSSYSATLALLIANENEKVSAVVAFSPGEYFSGMHIQEMIKGLQKPVFVTSSKEESEALSQLVKEMSKTNLTHYLPNEKGIHGSRALNQSTEGHVGYWNAFRAFLDQL